MLTRIREANHVAVGLNQTTKAIEQSTAVELFVAHDADTRMTSRIALLAEKHHVPITWVETMRELGIACGIEVGAATAAIVVR
ncbi:ribosomal L7Ae/L30e/S12e/Gadd45 family protein [Tumebacillus sp. ITR2]|uniref:Ribosomal L7Ae/L30e/S12e/Gadd45 family protein n=1 Tax=Tumebacillus amylolyticus TaxID=2801339 RepID=A0ABS1JHX5_9BACL|nr:ribosomal L7Ae/L30e/S12e/Gadd45 family protein [Tumebacillus amylolyticus]